MQVGKAGGIVTVIISNVLVKITFNETFKWIQDINEYNKPMPVIITNMPINFNDSW